MLDEVQAERLLCPCVLFYYYFMSTSCPLWDNLYIWNLIMARGTVSSFDAEKGYGRIRLDKSRTEYFVHGSSVAVTANPPLTLGQIVYFEILTGPHGSQAVAVRPANTIQETEMPLNIFAS